MVRQPVKEKENSEYKSYLLCFKIDLVSHLALYLCLGVSMNKVVWKIHSCPCSKYFFTTPLVLFKGRIRLIQRRCRSHQHIKNNIGLPWTFLLLFLIQSYPYYLTTKFRKLTLPYYIYIYIYIFINVKKNLFLLVQRRKKSKYFKINKFTKRFIFFKN